MLCVFALFCEGDLVAWRGSHPGFDRTRRKKEPQASMLARYLKINPKDKEEIFCVALVIHYAGL